MILIKLKKKDDQFIPYCSKICDRC